MRMRRRSPRVRIHRFVSWTILFSCLLLLPASLSANSITVFNTGVNGSGALLAVGATDGHYAITSSPCGATGAITEVPNGLYVGNTAVSQWITSSCQGSVGDFLYQTTFSLAGLDASTAKLTGSWATDNEGTIMLNGSSTGITLGCCSFGSLTPFTISSGFVSGLNTLVFDVHNDGGPSGLQVDISGTASLSSSAVPEPSTLLLFGAGIAAIGLLLRRQWAS